MAMVNMVYWLLYRLACGSSQLALFKG